MTCSRAAMGLRKTLGLRREFHLLIRRTFALKPCAAFGFETTQFLHSIPSAARPCIECLHLRGSCFESEFTLALFTLGPTEDLNLPSRIEEKSATTAFRGATSILLLTSVARLTLSTTPPSLHQLTSLPDTTPFARGPYAVHSFRRFW